MNVKKTGLLLCVFFSTTLLVGCGLSKTKTITKIQVEEDTNKLWKKGNENNEITSKKKDHTKLSSFCDFGEEPMPGIWGTKYSKGRRFQIK